jgi:hypothetical protein
MTSYSQAQAARKLLIYRPIMGITCLCRIQFINRRKLCKVLPTLLASAATAVSETLKISDI